MKQYKKKVAILQSNYIPWKGYFDIINSVDEFILYDDMQYTRRDWRNRNKIITPQGELWLSIPVDVKGKYYQKIKDTKVVDHDWVDNHWKALKMNYSRAKHFTEYADTIMSVYESCREEEYLSQINYKFIVQICKLLDISTKITWSMDYELVDGKTERLAALVKSAGGDYYLSGPAAKDYIEENVFKEFDIELAWMDYAGYKPYTQLSKEFNHYVSVLDLLFNMGSDSRDYIICKER